MFLRAAVTALHNKESFEGKNIDVTYVTPQLLASAMPTTSYLQSYYRMQLSTLLKFLNTKHPKHYHIWNLQEDKELGYEPESVVDENNNKLVTRAPTPDHNPLTMEHLVKVIAEMHAFIQKHPANVAVVHCKCGKGRTGSVISAYLMAYQGMSSEQARQLFTKQRMRLPWFNAVSIPSQVRFLGYLERTLRSVDALSMPLTPSSFVVTHVIVRNVQFEEYEVSLRPLDGSKIEVKDWWTTVKGTSHVLKQPTPVQLPADMVLSFCGYKRIGGAALPIAQVSIPFNVEFEESHKEDQLLADNHDAIAAATTTSTKPASLMLAQQGDSGMVYCPWDGSDGLSGLPIRGNRAFDSIEVYWSRVQPQFNAPNESLFTDQVPSLNSLHEKRDKSGI